MPPQNICTFVIPQKIFIFLEIPQNIETHNFEIQKMVWAYVYTKISEYPPLWFQSKKLRTIKREQKPNIIFYSREQRDQNVFGWNLLPERYFRVTCKGCLKVDEKLELNKKWRLKIGIIGKAWKSSLPESMIHK